MMANYLLDSLKELAYFCFYFLSVPLGFVLPLTGINNNPSKKIVIVFIRGILTLNPVYFFLKRYLEKQGYLVYMTNFKIEAHDLNQNAQLLSRYITKNHLKNIVLVGSSMGGIVGFHYVQKLKGWKKVEKLIAIGSPFKGSPLARLVFFLKSGKQISPNSQYLKLLFAGEIKNTDKIICISAKYDEIVPNGSSKIPGAKIEELKIAGHVNLLAFSNQVYRLIDRYASS